MNMSDNSFEHVSQLVDGELDEPLVARLLERMEQDSELQRRWECYHLISDTLRNHLADRVDPRLSAKVLAAIEAEATVVAPNFGWRLRAKELVGLAMAASITTIAVLGVYRLTQQSELSAPAQVASAGVAVASPVGSEHPADTPITYAGLYNYLIDHSAHASTSGMAGLLPYVRVVGHSVR
jgi:sigma-E factor negative regulatory protein RseA